MTGIAEQEQTISALQQQHPYLMPSAQLRIDAGIDEGGIMSLQAARDFLDKAKDFEAIRKQVNEKRSASDIGRDQGYDFTAEELNQALLERNQDPIDKVDIHCNVT